jgi:K(+)-stimulated pyrophosphate-energized sodium pump
MLFAPLRSSWWRVALPSAIAFLAALVIAPAAALADEASLVVPPLDTATLGGTAGAGGISGRTLLLGGMVVCVLGMAFGFAMYSRLAKMPVHQSMRDISELIYETCKTYLITQVKFTLMLEALLAAIIILYFGFLRHMGAGRVIIIVFCSLVGIAGSCSVAWFGMRINTLANSRAAFAALKGEPLPPYRIALMSGMSIGTVLISVELLVMLTILLFVPGEYAGPCFIGFAIGESLGAAVLRIAGGIFTKIADIGSDLMKIVFGIKEDDARNPGVIADCTGDNAGDSVGPTADGFETYGVTGVALITFIILAVHDPKVQVTLLVWIFVMRILMVLTSLGSYYISEAMVSSRYADAKEVNYEHPLTQLVWITSIVSVVVTYVASYFTIRDLGTDHSLWWKLSTIISCGTLAGAIIPEVVKVFTSTESKHVKEVVSASDKGGASLNVLSGLVAGNFGAYWMGIIIAVLMGIAFIVSQAGLGQLMIAESVFAFGLVAFGFLGMGPVTIAVDSYGPVTDNAQSVYELSLIESIPKISEKIKKAYGFTPKFEYAKHQLEANDGAGNTFKATAKPVLIGTAVVGATTMIFSIVMVLTEGLKKNLDHMSMLHPPFLLGLVTGGAVIYWFTGGTIQAVVTGAYRAVEYIKANIKLEGVERASIEDSKNVVAICTKYAQSGMLNIFLGVFFSTLAFACLEPFFFVGYLISIAIFGLYQALFMANAGGAWDNAKKIVEVDLKAKGTELHAASVVGDTIGDPFKDTSSVAMNPVIKFTTLFGLLAVELAIEIKNRNLTLVLAAVFFLLSTIFVYRSFYGMRIESEGDEGHGGGGGDDADDDEEEEEESDEADEEDEEEEEEEEEKPKRRGKARV